MRDQPFPRMLRVTLLLATALAVVGCTRTGDYGREEPPGVVMRGYDAIKTRVRHVLRRDEEHDLPLTAAEDALREAVEDLKSIHYGEHIIDRRYQHRGDGFARVEALTFQLRADRDRFSLFARAARRVVRIDAAREERLAGIDSFEARRDLSAVRSRRRANAGFIRLGLRTMRARLYDARYEIDRLSVAWPQVPMRDVKQVYDRFADELIHLHAEIDEDAFERLGAARGRPYK